MAFTFKLEPMTRQFIDSVEHVVDYQILDLHSHKKGGRQKETVKICLPQIKCRSRGAFVVGMDKALEQASVSHAERRWYKVLLYPAWLTFIFMRKQLHLPWKSFCISDTIAAVAPNNCS